MSRPAAGAVPAPVRDAGLQAERTQLAWHRTTMSQTVTALLLVHEAVAHTGPLVCAAALCSAAATGVTLLAGRLRRDTRPPPPAAMAATGAATAVAGLLVALFLLAPGG